MPPALSTIVAVATGPAPGGVGILRMSGPDALDVARAVARGLPAEPVPRHAYFTRLEDGRGGLLDEGLALHFPAPRSYTGEDVVELHAHGSPRLLSLLLAALLGTGRARLAEPGEFTRRAFVNGRLDLQRAEAVADLVSAESEAAVRAAAAQVHGALSGQLAPRVEALRALCADLEAVLAFPDEAGEAEAGLLPRVREESAHVEALAAAAARGRVVRRGARVVLAGPPNAGKSTLFNRLLGEERALVDDAPGTTRDVLEARLELDGIAVTLVDTAGLREAPGRLEALGVSRARKELAAADLVLLLLPPGEDPAPWHAEVPAGVARLQLRAKADAGARAELEPAWRTSGTVPGEASGSSARARGAPVAAGGSAPLSGSGLAAPGAAHGEEDKPGLGAFQAGGDTVVPRDGEWLPVSGLTGEGLPGLVDAVRGRLGSGGMGSAVAFASERHAECLRRAAEALSRAVLAAECSTLEVVAGEVGLALEALMDITGEDATEALLDDIFRRFCIGK